MRSARRAGQSLAGGSALGSPTTADQPATRDGWAHRAGSKPKRGVLTHTGLAGTRFLLPRLTPVVGMAERGSRSSGDGPSSTPVAIVASRARAAGPMATSHAFA